MLQTSIIFINPHPEAPSWLLGVPAGVYIFFMHILGELIYINLHLQFISSICHTPWPQLLVYSVAVYVSSIIKVMLCHQFDQLIGVQPSKEVKCLEYRHALQNTLHISTFDKLIVVSIIFWYNSVCVV